MQGKRHPVPHLAGFGQRRQCRTAGHAEFAGPGLALGDQRGEGLVQADATGGTAEQAQERFVSRAALSRLVEEEEVAQAVIAMLSLTGLCGADVDLSAGMVAY